MQCVSRLPWCSLAVCRMCAVLLCIDWTVFAGVVLTTSNAGTVACRAVLRIIDRHHCAGLFADHHCLGSLTVGASPVPFGVLQC